jgi:quinol monooxygenase YgiN
MMRTVLVRYRVKPEQAERNRELVRAVYDELDRTQPSAMQYATFQLADGVSFVHIHSSDGEGSNVLPQLAAFQAFQEGVKERCDEGPVVTELEEVGSYRFLDD